jgi:hypothetical protein
MEQQSGAVTFVSGNAPFAGTITAENSVLGTVAGAGQSMVFGYDPTRMQLVVGRPASNVVTLFGLDPIFASGFE